MKKVFALFLVLLLALPVSAENPLVIDGSGLVPEQQLQFLEDDFAAIARSEGYTPMVVTVDNFGGLSAEDYAANAYDVFAYDTDCILYLLSLEEGQWYILTNGRCADLLPDWQVAELGEELVPLIHEGRCFDAFSQFASRSAELMREAEAAIEPDAAPVIEQTGRKGFGKTVLICVALGMLVGGVVVAVMAVQMKSVRPRHTASDYVRPGSTQLTSSRDIFLYSRVTRTPRPKSNSSSGGGSRGGSSSRGGTGGRL